MSEEAPKPAVVRESRMAGLIAPKGTAPRPNEQPIAPAVVPASSPPAPPVAPTSAAPIGTGSKSLTLRLPDAEYERLRAHAYTSRKTHQTILAEALRQYLDAAGPR